MPCGFSELITNVDNQELHKAGQTVNDDNKPDEENSAKPHPPSPGILLPHIIMSSTTHG
jgi:hypothetical protein